MLKGYKIKNELIHKEPWPIKIKAEERNQNFEVNSLNKGKIVRVIDKQN